jgi:DNA-binding MarR family transcriptional regulator
MLSKIYQAKLEAYMPKRKRNLARLIYILHRYFNEWAEKRFKEDDWGEIRPEHLRLISIVSVEAMNNNVLAKKARVSKQAMSKMVNDLVNRGFIEVQPDPLDSRSKNISITKEGVDFLLYLNNCSKQLEINFEDIMGRKKTEQLIDILSELTEGILECENNQHGKK